MSGKRDGAPSSKMGHGARFIIIQSQFSSKLPGRVLLNQWPCLNSHLTST